jgi:hypothetical protein
MASGRILTCALATTLIAALALAACGGSDETTTVTETAAVTTTTTSADDAATTTDATGTGAETGTGEAAAEEIAPPDAKAQQQIDKIADGVASEQQKTDSAPNDTLAGGEGNVPALSFQQAKSGLSRARYCGNYVVAGPNTSCSFALNVAYDFFANGQPRRFISYSPVTGQAYRVYCRGIHPTVCVAGNSASIYIG